MKISPSSNALRRGRVFAGILIVLAIIFAVVDAAAAAGGCGENFSGDGCLDPPASKLSRDVQDVADAIVAVVNAEHGKRPFRVHVDPSQDGAEIVNGMADRVRAELFRRIGLEELLSPRVH